MSPEARAKLLEAARGAVDADGETSKNEEFFLERLQALVDA
jgi:hypothetical protein